jgi:hypothetical protein
MLIALVLLAQEAFTTNAVLSQAITSGYSLWPIHLIFVVTTSADICFGYVLGKWLQKLAGRYGRIHIWCTNVQRWAGRILGHRVERYGLFAFGTIAQPYITAFVGSFLSITFGEVFMVAFIADIIWYCCSLGIVLGIQAFLPARYILVGVIIATAMLMITVRIIRKVRKD